MLRNIYFYFFSECPATDRIKEYTNKRYNYMGDITYAIYLNHKIHLLNTSVRKERNFLDGTEEVKINFTNKIRSINLRVNVAKIHKL